MLTSTWYLSGAIVAVTVLRADLHQVAAAAQQRLVAHPDDRGLELVRHLGRRVGGRDHVAARDVDLVGEGESDRLPGDGLRQVAIAA